MDKVLSNWLVRFDLVQLLFVVAIKKQSLQEQSTLFHEIKDSIC